MSWEILKLRIHFTCNFDRIPSWYMIYFTTHIRCTNTTISSTFF